MSNELQNIADTGEKLTLYPIEKGYRVINPDGNVETFVGTPPKLGIEGADVPYIFDRNGYGIGGGYTYTERQNGKPAYRLDPNETLDSSSQTGAVWWADSERLWKSGNYIGGEVYWTSPDNVTYPWNANNWNPGPDASANPGAFTLVRSDIVSESSDWRSNKGIFLIDAPSTDLAANTVEVTGPAWGATTDGVPVFLPEGFSAPADNDQWIDPTSVAAADITDAGTAGTAVLQSESEAAARAALRISGVVPDGTDDEAIQAAMDEAGPGGVVSLEPIVYTINNTLSPPSALTLTGYGATLRRADLPETATDGTVADGATSFDVTSVPSHWRAGTALYFARGDRTHDENGHIDTDATTLTIDSINGNTITLTQPVGLPEDGSLDGAGEYPDGTVVAQSCDLIRATAGGGINIYGVSFDGNRAENPSKDWLVNWGVMSKFHTQPLRLVDCFFENSPGESVGTDSPAIITGNQWRNCNGSAIHVSTGLIGDGDYDESRGIVFAHNHTYNMNEEVIGMQHGEAVVTYSAQSNNVLVHDNVFLESHGALIGPISHTNGSEGGDHDLKFRDNIARNKTAPAGGETTGAIFFSGAPFTPVDSYRYNYEITGNTFDRVGDILMSSQGVDTTAEHRNVVVRGNTFFGGRVQIQGGRDVVIDDNVFYGSGYDFPASEVGSSAYILHSNGDRTRISGNRIYGSATLDGDADTGIEYSSGADGAEYRYNHIIEIKDNRIERLEIGILGRISNPVATNNYQKSGQIHGNWIATDVANAYGIQLPAGWIARNNEVILLSSSCRAGIEVACVDDTETGFQSNRSGGIAIGNTVRAVAAPVFGSIRIGKSGHTHNAVVTGNLIGTAIEDNTGGNSTVSDNTSIPTETDLDDHWEWMTF